MDNRKRTMWVDFAKGIAMLFVIIGHTIDNYYIRTFIFTFHMPAFFFLSGYTNRDSICIKDFWNKTKKMALKLLVPAYCLWAVRNVLYYWINHRQYSVSQYGLSALFASGTDYKGIPAFGMMWFLVVLFSIRIIYDFIQIYIRHEIVLGGVVCLFCISGMLIGRTIYLPFSFDLSLVCMMFYFGGILLRKKNNEIRGKLKLVFTVLSIIIWIGMLMLIFKAHLKFELAYRQYPFFIMSIIMGLAACYSLQVFSSKLQAIHFISPVYKLIAVIGKHSIILFYIHAFDTVWFPFIQNLGNTVVVLVFRLAIDLILFWLVLFFCREKTKNSV